MCNGRSAQQESGAALSKNSMFTAGAKNYIYQCLQAYGISYGIALENTEYGESDLIYGYGQMADSECTSPSRSLSTSTHSESVASASDSEHESTSYASSSLGHLRPPPRKKGK